MEKTFEAIETPISTSSAYGMETWQIEQIQRNLPDLIKLTSCNIMLVAMLRQAKVLSEIEDQELMHGNLLPMTKSKRLYEILVTRNNSYHILRDVLESTQQTGALEILNDGLLTEVMQNLGISVSRKIQLKNNINVLDQLGETLFHKAAQGHNIRQLEHLKLLKADMEVKNAKGETPLLKIVYSEQDCTDILMWFIHQEVNLNATDNNGYNIVFLAIRLNKPKLYIETLINLGMNWNFRNTNGVTVLHVATKYGNIEMLQYFKDMGVGINEKCNLGCVPLLHLGTTNQNFSKTLSWYIIQGGNLSVTDAEGNNLVFSLIHGGKGKSELEEAVKLGANWKITNSDGQSVIHIAVLAGNLKALQYFNSLGADVNARDNLGGTPVLDVPYADQSFCEMLEWFNQAGIDLNAFDDSGNNLFLHSVMSGRSIAELEYVHSLGVIWNVTNIYGNTVMHEAARFGNAEMLKYLKSLGATVNARNTRGETPLLRVFH